MIIKRLCSILLFLFTFFIVTHATGNDGFDRTRRKTVEIAQFVNLSNQQASLITAAYTMYLESIDSSLYLGMTSETAANVRYLAGKTFHNRLINILTERQLAQYVQGNFAPELNAKSDYKVSLLEEEGNYSQSELQTMRSRIYNYLLQEKIVYFRHKYNYRAQKENISRLKKQQPACLVESNLIEKRAGQTGVIR